MTDLIETIRVLGPKFDYQLRRPLAMADEEVAAPRGRLDSDVVRWEGQWLNTKSQASPPLIP